ncbi:putative sulfate exporter family transporter [Isoptericola sp. 4D.3]|uniref:Sulfate exporter family transporter n=1 Tax=Isoptericola peretonis TaxID=2918523 RepID=A0ABT0J910_9MICO|nr:putative sulfate exporter family transporter [Isoptericola sp. 4D.3]
MPIAPPSAAPAGPSTRRRPRETSRLAPGLALAAVATVVLLGASRVLAPLTGGSVSPLVLALVAGAVVGSVLGRDVPRRGGAARFAARVAPGTDWTARTVLRAGVVLLGLQLSVPDVLALGWLGIAVVVATVTCTFAAVLALGRLLRVPRATALLVATGFSICGAAAVSAMTGVLERDPRGGPGAPARLRDDVAAALALVTVFGTLAIVALPALAGALGLSDHQAGLWIGASVQEVAQVVAAAGTVSAAALATATVTKLARVVLLAPLVAGAGVALSRRAARTVVAPDDPGQDVTPARRTPPVPGFVLGFLAAVLVRSTGVLPDAVLDAASQVTTVLFVAAMFALGTGVDVPRLARTARRPLLLGALGAVVVTGVGLAAVLLLVP